MFILASVCPMIYVAVAVNRTNPFEKSPAQDLKPSSCFVIMKRAIAMHRAQKATQQRKTAVPTETKGPTATNVVDHWGGAIPLRACVGFSGGYRPLRFHYPI